MLSQHGACKPSLLTEQQVSPFTYWHNLGIPEACHYMNMPVCIAKQQSEPPTHSFTHSLFGEKKRGRENRKAFSGRYRGMRASNVPMNLQIQSAGGGSRSSQKLRGYADAVETPRMPIRRSFSPLLTVTAHCCISVARICRRYQTAINTNFKVRERGEGDTSRRTKDAMCVPSRRSTTHVSRHRNSRLGIGRRPRCRRTIDYDDSGEHSLVHILAPQAPDMGILANKKREKKKNTIRRCRE